MKISFLPSPSGLIRYFLLAGILAFSGYLVTQGQALFLVVLGPPIHVASFFLTQIESLVEFEAQKIDFTFLLPATVFYFIAVGFLIKRLLHEPGRLRLVSITLFLVFLTYLHVHSWIHLMRYLEKGPPLS